MKSKEGTPVYTFWFDSFFLKGILPILIIILVYSSYKPIMIIIVLYLLYTLYIHFYADRIANQVSIHMDKKIIRLFLNEMDETTIEIHNNAPVHIAHGKLDFILNEKIELLESKFIQKNLNEFRYSLNFEQKGKTVYKLSVPFKAKARGVFYIEDLNLLIHDFFESSSVYFPTIVRGNTEIIVYPKQLEVKNLSVLNLNRIGEEEISHSYVSDETSVVGIKSYEKESFRHIHWKATAKMQKMYAKQYQYITNKRYTIMLCITDRNGFTIHEMGEKLISHTAFLCSYLIKQKFSYELYVNYMNKEGVFKLALNSGINHLQLTLETLAKIQDGLPFIKENQFISLANANMDVSDEIIYINGEEPPNMRYRTGYFYIGAEGELRRIGGKAEKLN